MFQPELGLHPVCFKHKTFLSFDFRNQTVNMLPEVCVTLHASCVSYGRVHVPAWSYILQPRAVWGHS